MSKLCRSSEGGSLLDWFSRWSEGKHVSGVQGVRVWYKFLWRPLGSTVLLPEGFQCYGWDDYGSALLPCGSSKFLPLLFSEPSKKSTQSLFLFLQSFLRTLPVSELFFFFLISGVQLSFKTPNFKDSHSRDPHCCSWEESCFLFAVRQQSRQVVAQPPGSSQFMVIQSSKLALRLAACTWLPHSYPWKQCST